VRPVTRIGSFLVVALVGSILSAAQAQDRLPTGGFGIQSRAPDIEAHPHPLFNTVKTSLIELQKGNDKAFGQLLSPDAKLTFWSNGESPIASGALRAAMDSCTGPYLFDESSGWVQFSWVCQSPDVVPLDKFIKLKNFGELGATVWFENGKIKKMVLMEPIGAPGMRFYSLPQYKARNNG
jgi:hypothetical protein